MMDESVVEAPKTFRLDRPSQHDVHFGAALHQCLGIHIAEAHMTEMVGHLLTLPGLKRTLGRLAGCGGSGRSRRGWSSSSSPDWSSDCIGEGPYTYWVSGNPRVNRSAFRVQSLHDEPDDHRYWWARTPAERLAALETMRRVVYGRTASTGRLQRVLEITHRIPR